MGNICYTQYRVEGPTSEIRKLAVKINEDVATGGANGYMQGLLYGHEMERIMPENIHTMNDGWSVLYFEAPSKWSPCWESWQDYVRETVPQAVLYYYGEELGCSVCMTNDVWRKYFRFDYVTVLKSGHKTRKDILKTFATNGEFRLREDQWQQYFKYWDKQLLKNALLRFVPYRRRYVSELIEAMDRLMDREDWWQEGTRLGIYKIKRIEAENELPCNHCEGWNRVCHENEMLIEKLYRLECLVDKQK